MQEIPNVSMKTDSNQSDKIIHNINPTKTGNKPNLLIMSLVVIIIIAGVFTGYLLSSKKGSQFTVQSGGKTTTIKTNTVVGSTDKKSFKDVAEGTLQRGGIDGEGTHKLIRPGGASQNVYLTSSIVDLDQYVGKKVRIWGETFSAQKAGWLMDVGRIELL